MRSATASPKCRSDLPAGKLRHAVSRILLTACRSFPAGRSLRHFGEAVAERIYDQLQAVRNIELGKHRAKVMRDSSFADKQSFTNLFILQSLTNQRDDFSLTISQ